MKTKKPKTKKELEALIRKLKARIIYLETQLYSSGVWNLP